MNTPNTAALRAALLQTISELPTKVTAGNVSFLQSRSTPAGGGYTNQNPRLAKWAGETLAKFDSYTKSLKTTAHPQSAQPLPDNHPKNLTPADLYWIQNLPKDPTQIPFRDASRLAQLAHHISAMQNPSDANLIASIWEPVRDHHDRRQADALIHNAKLALPDIAGSTKDVLADMIRAELPQLTESEATLRASDLIRAATERRTRAAEKIRAQGEQTLAEAEARTRARTALTIDEAA